MRWLVLIRGRLLILVRCFIICLIYLGLVFRFVFIVVVFMLILYRCWCDCLICLILCFRIWLYVLNFWLRWIGIVFWRCVWFILIIELNFCVFCLNILCIFFIVFSSFFNSFNVEIWIVVGNILFVDCDIFICVFGFKWI